MVFILNCLGSCSCGHRLLQSLEKKLGVSWPLAKDTAILRKSFPTQDYSVLCFVSVFFLYLLKAWGKPPFRFGVRTVCSRVRRHSRTLWRLWLCSLRGAASARIPAGVTAASQTTGLPCEAVPGTLHARDVYETTWKVPLLSSSLEIFSWSPRLRKTWESQ